MRAYLETGGNVLVREEEVWRAAILTIDLDDEQA
jgi:hypothetical protein